MDPEKIEPDKMRLKEYTSFNKLILTFFVMI